MTDSATPPEPASKKLSLLDAFYILLYPSMVGGWIGYYLAWWAGIIVFAAGIGGVFLARRLGARV